MRSSRPIWGVFLILLSCQMARADFKYTETTKISGGMMAGMAKMMGAFSKQMRQAEQPVTSTIYVKGNRMRRDNANGEVQIIDLPNRQFIYINPAQHSYYIMTFDQMREAMQKMQQAMQQGMHQQNAKPGQPQVTMTPHIEVKNTGQTRQILGQNAQEVNINMGLDMQSQNAQNPAQNGSMTMTTTVDEWVAPNISGYDEVRNFYQQMAKEINWVPSAGMSSDPRMRQSMVELAKSGKIPNGLPLLSTTSMGMALPPGAAGAQGANTQANNQGQQSSSSSQQNTQSASNPEQAAAKALGGLMGGFGGFGRHKKKQQQDQSSQQDTSASTNPNGAAAPAAGGGSLMQITMEVTSFSTDSIDSGIFEIPAGFTKAEPPASQYPH